MAYSFSMLILLVTLLRLSPPTRGHFLSVEDLEEFYNLEEKLVETFTTYIEEQKQILEVLDQRYGEQLRRQPKIEDPDDYLGNPLNVHAMLKRLVMDWPLTLVLLGGSIADEEDEPMNLPSIQDYHAAVHSIVRLQQVYSYSTEALVRGLAFTGTDNTSLLTGDDCLAVGRDLYVNHHYLLAIEWFNEALAQVTNKTEGEKVMSSPASDQVSTTPAVELIYEYLALATCFTGNQKHSKRYFKKLFNDFPEFQPTPELIKDHLLAVNDTCKKLMDNDSLKAIDHMLQLTWQEDEQLSMNYSKLCQEETLPVASQSLSCFLNCLEEPYHRLHPIKTEILHVNPDVYLTYDVIYQAESEFLMKEMISEDSQYTKTSGRVHQSWIPLPTNSSVSESILQRAGWISVGTVHNTHEQVCIAAFPPGAEYVVQRDLDVQTEPKDVIRHGSIIFFLQEPQLGGLMAFPHLGLSVAPVMGAALTYKNVNYRNKVDPRMVYGSCPVIQGHKTTLTMWFKSQIEENAMVYRI